MNVCVCACLGTQLVISRTGWETLLCSHGHGVTHALGARRFPAFWRCARALSRAPRSFFITLRLDHLSLGSAQEKAAAAAAAAWEEEEEQLITFVGGTCGSVNTRAFNKNLKELKVLGHIMMHDTIRKGLVQMARSHAQPCSKRGEQGGGGGNGLAL